MIIIIVVVARCFIAAASITIVVLSMTLLIDIQMLSFKVLTAVCLCMFEQQQK